MENNVFDSALNRLIPAEVKNDDFYRAIRNLAKEEDIQTVIEIGSSSGQGSTEAFVTGLRENPNQPLLFCLEISKPRFAALQNTYKDDDFVKCYNVSSVSIEQFADEEEVIKFYKSNQTNLNNYPLEEVITWLHQDIEYIKQSGVSGRGIAQIKEQNNIDFFDVALIDGSEFTGSSELDEVYGAKYIFLDDTNTFKNYDNLQRLYQDSDYTVITENKSVRNGFALFKKRAVQPISYTTIKSAVEAIQGFMVPGQEEYLFNKVKSLPNDAVIVEIGSYKGRSTVAMSYACIGTNRKIYCIDTWDGNDKDFSDRNLFDIWQENIEKNGLSQYVVPLRGDSHQILSQSEELTGDKIKFTHRNIGSISLNPGNFPITYAEISAVTVAIWLVFSFHTNKLWRRIANFNVDAPTQKYSNLDEETIIDKYLNRLNIENKYCVDIAASDGITMSNTYFLYKQGWSGLSVEYDSQLFSKLARRYTEFEKVNLSKCMVTPENVVSLMKTHQVPEKFSFLNLDIDGYDYFVLDKILSSFRPLLISVEINEKIPPPLKFTVNYSPNYVWNKDHFYGQSISQLNILCQQYNYAIVELHYNNAFLIPQEISPVTSLTPEEAYRRGYLDKPDRKNKFPWNADLEQVHNLPPQEALIYITNFFSKYEGQFTCSI